MSNDDSVNTITVSFEGYEVAVSFYPIQSSYYDSIRQKFTTDQTTLASYSVCPINSLADSMSLIRVIKPSSLATYSSSFMEENNITTVPCSVDIFHGATDYVMDQPNVSNIQSILSSIVSELHANLTAPYSSFKKLNSRLFENGIITRLGEPSFKNALFSTKTHHFGEYKHQPKPYPICTYYTDHSVNITSSSYQYANNARFATCSCPSMIAASPAKDSPVPCLWKTQKDCMMYSPNSFVIREDFVYPKADTSITLHVKLTEDKLNDNTSVVTIFSDDKPVVVFDKSSSEFDINACISIYEDYISDIAHNVTPVSVQLNQDKKSKFLINLISE